MLFDLSDVVYYFLFKILNVFSTRLREKEKEKHDGKNLPVSNFDSAACEGTAQGTMGEMNRFTNEK